MNKPNPNSQLDDDLWTPEERAEPEVSQMDIAYAELFNSPDGEKVLKHLKSITLDQPSWIPVVTLVTDFTERVKIQSYDKSKTE